MEIEYNVRVPRSYRANEKADAFWEWYESENENVKFTFEDIYTAGNAQKSFLNILNRNNIFDVIVMRRKNAVFLVRDKGECK